MDEYNGYTLDCCYYQLSERDFKYLDAVLYLVDNKLSLRVAAENCLISKSSLHRFIRDELRSISYDLYGVVNKILLKNK